MTTVNQIWVSKHIDVGKLHHVTYENWPPILQESCSKFEYHVRDCLFAARELREYFATINRTLSDTFLMCEHRPDVLNQLADTKRTFLDLLKLIDEKATDR